MSDFDDRRRLVYAFPDWGRMIFVPVCSECGRFVAADKSMGVRITGTSEAGLSVAPDTPNATCKRHGRVGMVWEGFE